MSIDVVTTIADVKDWRRKQPLADVGLVPTMGYLHDGHLSLVARSVKENPKTAASIFVNPAQFGPGEDLAAYPRDLDRDVALLAEAGCDLVFAPGDDEMFSPRHQTWVQVGQVAEPLEGAHRPGHFRGVATVVLKLFSIFEPARAYFGQKDAQQLAVVKTMTRDLNLPVEVVACSTAREPDGLAMSSRNTYLSAEEREAATILYRALVSAETQWREGVTDAGALRDTMLRVLQSEPLARVDYASVADPDTMIELEDIDGPAVLSLAVHIGATRLIDNVLLGGEHSDTEHA